MLISCCLKVAATESTRAATRTPGPVERAKVTKRLHDDKAYVIHVQKQEMSLLNTEFERKADERKRQYDDRRRRLLQIQGCLKRLRSSTKKICSQYNDRRFKTRSSWMLANVLTVTN